MDGVLGIFKSVASSKSEVLDIYIDALNEHNAFKAEKAGESDTITQTIGSLLTKPDTRLSGLKILSNFIEECGIELLEQKWNLWMSLTLKACNLNELGMYGSSVFDTIVALVLKGNRSPELVKVFNSNYLHKLYDTLQNVPSSVNLSALRCIETCLRLYPGPSGASRQIIQNFVNIFIDTYDEELIYWSGKCQHLLQQVKGGSSVRDVSKSQWESYQLNLLGSLHLVLDEIFAKCSEIGNESANIQNSLKVKQLELSDDPIQRNLQLYVRYRNLIAYLITALREPLPVVKSISPKLILNIVSRALCVTCLSLKTNLITDNIALGAVLPKIHFHAFQLLEALILTLKGHLKVHYQIILGLLIDALKASSTGSLKGQKKPFYNIRIKTYEIIALWCSSMECGSRVESIAEILIQQIMNDITPYQNEVTLKVLSGTRKHMTKKARRVLHKAQNESSNMSQTHSNKNAIRKENLSDSGNQNICAAALSCLQEVLQSSANFLKPTTLKMIHSKLLQICSLFYEFSLNKDQLYYNSECRFEAYNTLNAIVMNTHHMCPPPTQMIIKIVQTARWQDGSKKIRSQCASILRGMEKLVHPQKEGLLFPIDISDVRNAFRMHGQELVLDDFEAIGPEEDELSENQSNNCDEISKISNETNNSSSNTQHSESANEELEINTTNIEINQVDQLSNEIISTEYLENGTEEQSSEDFLITEETDEQEMLNLPPTLKRDSESIQLISTSLHQEKKLKLSNSEQRKSNSGQTAHSLNLNSHEEMCADLVSAFVDELND